MQIVYSLISFLVGFFTLYITYKDEKARRPSLSVSYITHLKGYIGGIAFIIIGYMLLKEGLE